jgi:predicted translin family RNA/ssDNA-binding protein
MAKAIDKADFSRIRKELEKQEMKREGSISKSREIIKLSKQIIYAVHRNDMKKAGSIVSRIKRQISGLPKKESYDTGMINVAEQEYVEAVAYYSFVKGGKLPAVKGLGVNITNYLTGICDLTGELGRKAVNSVINGNFSEAMKIKGVVEEIYGEFLQMDLRNSELRKKSDQIKWNLKKLEEIAYDIRKKVK